MNLRENKGKRERRQREERVEKAPSQYFFFPTLSSLSLSL